MILVQDTDFTLHVGDVLEELAGLPDESVHCVVTSPPYWGLRDYGTDGQIGLEATPELFVASMVAVFREVRRVLRRDGTCFLNIGDSYFNGSAARPDARARDTTYTAPQGSPDPDSACLDLCDGCADDLLHRTPSSTQPRPVSPSLAAPTGRGTSPADSVRGASDDAPRVAPVSTTFESSTPPPVLCWRCGTQPASVSLRAATTSTRDAQASDRTGPYTNDTEPLESVDRSPDTDASALAYLYSTIAARRLRPKDLVLIPQILALALQLDGWIVRSEIVWGKLNPMPESVTDRPTKAHEQIWMLTRSPRYFFDADAVREPHNDKAGDVSRFGNVGKNGGQQGQEQPDAFTRMDFPKRPGGREYHPAGRNVRSVWEIATQPYPEAHFATFPEALPERCIKAGTSERGCCPECGAPWERETEGETFDRTGDRLYGGTLGHNPSGTVPGSNTRGMPDPQRRTVGWKPSCDHGQSESDFRREHWEELLVGRVTVARRPLDPVPCTVLDPFMGSGTTALVARKLGRKSIGIELNPDYAALCARRLQQLSLLA